MHNRVWFSVLALVTPLAFAGCSGAESSTGEAASLQSGSAQASPHESKLESLVRRANEGDALAQYNLGLLYDSGGYVEMNYAKAVGWYRKAAEQGLAEAQYNLAACYYSGDGVRMDYSEAASWYGKAAKQGHADSQYRLAVLFYNGDGVRQDYREAAKWYLKAAEQGHENAQRKLGECYYYGLGVNRDRVEAAKWRGRVSIHQEDENAQYNLGSRYADDRIGLQED